MTYVSVPRALLARNLNSYSDEGHEAKEAFHRDGQKFLKSLAKALGLQPSEFEVRSNKGGIAVSGEVTLHSDDLYLQLTESAMGPGVQALYRTCDSRKDYCGHQNHFAAISHFQGAQAQGRLVQDLKRMMQSVREAKFLKATATC